MNDLQLSKLNNDILSRIGDLLGNDHFRVIKMIRNGEAVVYSNEKIVIILRQENKSLILVAAKGADLLPVIDWVYNFAKHFKFDNVKYYTTRGRSLQRYCKKYNPVKSGVIYDGYHEYIVEVIYG